MESFLNIKYKFEMADSNYDAYMKAIGLSFLSRKIAKSIACIQQVQKLSDNEYALNTCYHVHTHVQKFVPGVEREAMSPDGRKIKNLFTIEGNKLIEKQIEANREATIIREFTPTGLIGEATIGKLSCVSSFKVMDDKLKASL